MDFKSKKLCKPVVWGIAILAGLTFIYTGIWFFVALQLESSLANWANKQRDRGWAIEFGKVVTTGFPYKWRIDINKPLIRLKAPSKPFYWTGDQIHIIAQPWNLSRVDFYLKGNQRLVYGAINAKENRNLAIKSGLGKLLFNKNVSTIVLLPSITQITSLSCNV